jgi:hypothetical protein
MWRKNVLFHKRMKSANLLQEKLFMLHPIFREHLLTHRRLTYDMSQHKFVDISLKLDCQSIESFAIEQ